MTISANDLIASGREAMERSDWATAFEQLQEAASSEKLEASALEDLAHAAWWSGRPDDCIDAREQAYAAYTKSGEPSKAAMVALALAEDHFHTRASPLGHGWLKRAARRLEAEPESVEHGWLTRTQAVIAFESDNDLEKGLELAQRAHEIGVEFRDLDLQAISLHDQGRITVAGGDVDEGMAIMDEAMVAAVGGELGPLYTGKIYCNMIDICEQLADYRRAGDWSDAAKRWCERAGHSSGFPGVCRIHRAEIMRLRGDWASAEAEAQRAAGEVGNFVDFAGEAFYEIGQIRMHMGDFAQAEEAFRQAHGLGRDPQPGMALLQLAQGNSESAWTLISQSLADATAPLKKARLLPAIIEVALARADPESARAAVTELSSIAEEYGSPALVAQAEHGQGAVKLADGDAEQAGPHLRKAIELWRANDFPYLAAKSQMVLAQAFRSQGSVDSAELEFGAARATFEQLGAMADVRAALHAMQAPTRDKPKGNRSTLALMFTDIVDSTALIGVIGDQAWEQLLRWHNKTLRSLFAGAGGNEVENTGDGFFASFDRPQAAVDCAVDIQRTLSKQREEQGFAPEVRIGLHIGKVTQVATSLAGEDVHKAARICSHAKGGEILASTDLAGMIEAPNGVGDPHPIELKGFAEEAEVVSLKWM